MPTSRRPHLLYVSPTWPRPTGNGLAMRAYRVLEALSYRYRVSLLTNQAGPVDVDAGSAVASLCEHVTVLRADRVSVSSLPRHALRWLHLGAYHAWYRQPTEWYTVSRQDRALLSATYANVPFDLVHVFRLFSLPLWHALPASAVATPAQLDIDDVESVTRERLAALAERNGDTRLAYAMRRDVDAYRRIERRDLERFVRVFVCSETDRCRFADSSLRVDVIPNIVDVGDIARCAGRDASHPFVFLFVGSLTYYPNQDAAAFFCRDVAPLIRQMAPGPFEIRMVARGSEQAWQAVPDIPEIRREPLQGTLADEYRKADAVIVPTRAGGGTRIKTLEAFAFQKAVVSTAIGVEGLDVQADEHALVGDSAADFAAHCVRLMRQPALRTRLAERAFALVTASYSPGALRRRLDEVDGLAPETTSADCAPARPDVRKP